MVMKNMIDKGEATHMFTGFIGISKQHLMEIKKFNIPGFKGEHNGEIFMDWLACAINRN